MAERQQQVDEFLASKAALSLLFELGENAKTYSELVETIPVSSSTLHRRLKEGVQFGLWQQTLEQHQDGTATKRYALTKTGQELFDSINSKAVEWNKEWRDVTKRWQQEKERVLDNL